MDGSVETAASKSGEGVFYRRKVKTKAVFIKYFYERATFYSVGK